MKKLSTVEVSSGRIGGLYYSGGNESTKLLVLFNQWRSGANSILSQYIAKLIFKSNKYGGVLFIDRIASGGVSDNQLSKEEKKLMPTQGELLFADTYANEVYNIVNKYNLPKQIVLGGSSAGSPAALITAAGFVATGRKLQGVILVEPAGLKKHGIKGHAAIPHALSKHLVAYRHRIQRGWWTPMDKEQYFAKGKMFEYRARYFASDRVYGLLIEALADSKFPPITLILSKNSHIHTATIRDNLKQATVKPHRILEVTGNHDHICQPPNLKKYYCSEV